MLQVLWSNYPHRRNTVMGAGDRRTDGFPFWLHAVKRTSASTYADHGGSWNLERNAGDQRVGAEMETSLRPAACSDRLTSKCQPGLFRRLHQQQLPRISGWRTCCHQTQYHDRQPVDSMARSIPSFQRQVAKSNAERPTVQLRRSWLYVWVGRKEMISPPFSSW